MRAVLVTRPGESDPLEVVDLPTPDAGPGEVLVEVAAAGVNRADLLQAQGHYPPPPGASDVLGLEAAGRIVAVGDGVDPSRVGERVSVLLAGGGYAEYVAVPAGQAAPTPPSLDDVTAAGLMETTATVWSNLVTTAGLTAGETLLVHGGAGGIGTTAIQLAVARGAHVVVTVGTEEKAAACRELGADLAIVYRDTDFGAALKDAGIRPDVILDIMGAKYLDSNVRALNTGGRLVVIGLQGGVKGELDLNRLLMKRASVTATSLRARPVAEKSAIVADLVDHVWPLVEDGRLRPHVHTTFDLADAAEAHRVLRESSHTGKVVLTVRSLTS